MILFNRVVAAAYFKKLSCGKRATGSVLQEAFCKKRTARNVLQEAELREETHIHTHTPVCQGRTFRPAYRTRCFVACQGSADQIEKWFSIADYIDQGTTRSVLQEVYFKKLSSGKRASRSSDKQDRRQASQLPRWGVHRPKGGRSKPSSYTDRRQANQLPR